MPAWTLESIRNEGITKRQAAALPLYSPDDSNAGEILTITGVFLAAATIVVGLRCYVRLSLLKVFGVDDWLMLLALAFAGATFACFKLETDHGMGKHTVIITKDPDALPNITHIMYFHSLIIMVGVSTVKVSIAFFLLRLAPRKSHQIALYGIICFIVALTITCAMTLIFQCLPISAAWDFSLRPPPVGTGTAKCYSNNTFRNLGMMNSVFNIVTDALFATLPIPLIWSLQLNNRTKTSLIAILSLGWFACAAAIVKAVEQWPALNDLDWTYKDSFSVWNYIEFTIGILASSLPTIKPLFNWALDTARGMTSGGRSHIPTFIGGSGQKGATSLGYYKTSDNSVIEKTIELRSMASKRESLKSPYNVEINGKHVDVGNRSIGVGERDLWELERGKSSEESILPLSYPEAGKNRIVRTTEVHVK